MDDEFGFGSSVWSAPSDPPRLLNLTSAAFSMPSPALSHDQFDDFEDFHTPPQTQNPSIVQDDDFADFADFGGAGESEATFTFEEEVDFGEEVAVVEPSQLTWRTLQLDPLPAEKDLKQQIEDILGPEWTQDLSDVTIEGDVRQVEGIGQILVDPERYVVISLGRPLGTEFYSRQLYNMLVNLPPLMEPVNWIRSRIRQQHLISLGLPVNLDEMLPQASAKPLPPLHISTRPMSLPPVAPNNPLRNMPASRDNSRPGTPRPSTPQPAVRPGMPAVNQLGLGPKPRLDEQRINELLSLDPGMVLLFFCEKWMYNVNCFQTN